MPLIRFTDLANTDRQQIQAYLTINAGSRVTARYNNDFGALYDRLESHPLSGAPRFRLGRNIRIGIVAPYVVIYRYAPGDGEILVVRVVDGRRRINRAILRQ